MQRSPQTRTDAARAVPLHGLSAGTACCRWPGLHTRYCTKGQKSKGRSSPCGSYACFLSRHRTASASPSGLDWRPRHHHQGRCRHRSQQPRNFRRPCTSSLKIKIQAIYVGETLAVCATQASRLRRERTSKSGGRRVLELGPESRFRWSDPRRGRSPNILQYFRHQAPLSCPRPWWLCDPSAGLGGGPRVSHPSGASARDGRRWPLERYRRRKSRSLPVNLRLGLRREAFFSAARDHPHHLGSALKTHQRAVAMASCHPSRVSQNHPRRTLGGGRRRLQQQ